ncbi:MAG: hypothetical protein IJ716_13130 [Lachnospiraceae bacterium]|nr:hypothetical protein [Lachnospiraceae bacterium]
MIKTSKTNQNVLMQNQPSGFCHALSVAWLLHSTNLKEKMNLKVNQKVDRGRFCTEEHFYQHPELYTNIMQAQQKITLLITCWRYLFTQNINTAPQSTAWGSDITAILTKFMPRYASEPDAIKRTQITLEAINLLTIDQMLTDQASDYSLAITHYSACADKSFWQAANAMNSGEGMLITLYNNDFSIGHTIAFSKFADGIWTYDPNHGCTYGMADDFEESNYLTDICRECGLGEPCHLFCTKIKLA